VTVALWRTVCTRVLLQMNDITIIATALWCGVTTMGSIGLGIKFILLRIMYLYIHLNTYAGRIPHIAAGTSRRTRGDHVRVTSYACRVMKRRPYILLYIRDPRYSIYRVCLWVCVYVRLCVCSVCSVLPCLRVCLTPRGNETNKFFGRYNIITHQP